MKNKAVAILLTVLLTGTLAIMYNTEKVGADATIYIRPDGSVDPPTTPIQRDGDVYTFTDNINETIVVQRDNITVDGNGYRLQGAGSGTGLDLSNRNNVTINKTHITEWGYGVHLYNLSSSNILSDNNLTNTLRGIFISNSSSNIISRNKVVNNTIGIFLWLTNTTTVTDNEVSNNGEDGIYIGYSSFNNTIINNTLFDNSWAAIYLGFEITTGNVIMGNNITKNVWGIYIDYSFGNTFYHNSLHNNTEQVFIAGATSIWDNGYPSGGNYWSDYTGVDLYWGPYQNLTGSDGIGDTLYIIDENNQDNYPLMSPYEYWSNPILGDINKDMKVDHKDLLQLTIAYGSTPEKPNWNPNCDFNGDNKVDVSDLFDLSKNYGKTSP